MARRALFLLAALSVAGLPAWPVGAQTSSHEVAVGGSRYAATIDATVRVAGTSTDDPAPTPTESPTASPRPGFGGGARSGAGLIIAAILILALLLLRGRIERR